MPRKKYKIRGIIDAIFAVLTNLHSKEREFSSRNISIKPIICGIISTICTVSKDLRIVLSLQEFSIGFNTKSKTVKFNGSPLTSRKGMTSLKKK